MAKSLILGISGAAILAVSGTAFADVTPEEVWQSWQDMSKTMGQVITAESAERDGDTLIVSKITMSSTTPDAQMSGTMAELRFTDAGDGTVLVEMPPEYPITMTLPAGAERPKPVEIALDISQEGARLTASGDPDAVNYDLAAPNMKIKLNRIDGVAAQNLTVEATLADIKGSYASDAEATMTSDFTIGGIALAVVGSDQTSEMRLTSAIKDVTMTSTGTMIGALGGPDFMAALSAGAKTTTQISYGSADFDVEMTAEEGPSTAKGTTESGMISAGMGAEGLDYAVSQKGLTVTMTAAQSPVQNMSMKVDETAFAIKMPLVQSDMSQPFAFQTKLTNMTLSDEIWAMFDPMAALPRDPMNLVIDTEGMMKITKALTPSSENPSELPAQLESMTLKELQLSLAGAELTGTGSGTMDYPAAGNPLPSGTFDFKLTGANTLMDNLVAAGFLAADELMMPRMMLAMIGVPDPAGGDSLISKIDIKDKGVFANGQKLYDLP